LFICIAGPSGRQCKLLNMTFRFGNFSLDTETGQLTGPDGVVVMRRQAWRLLVELLEQAPALVERDQLLDRVWGRSALSPNALPQTISELRQALGDHPRKPIYIETVHGRGYRMVCPVECLKDQKSQGRGAGEERLRAVPQRFGRLPLVTGVAVALLLAIVLWPQRPTGPESLEPSDSGQSMATILRQQAEVALARHDPATAAAHWRALVLMEPDQPEWALAQAEAELDALQGEQARRSLALLATEPAQRHHPRLLILQARLAEIDGDFSQAVHLTDAALSQARSLNALALVSRAAEVQARAWTRQGELEIAAQTLASTLDELTLRQGESEWFELAINLIAVRREQGRLADARVVLELASEQSPPETWRRRLGVEQALIDASDGQHPQAWEKLQALAAHWPENAGPELDLALYNAVGMVAAEMGRIDEALDAYQKGFALARSSSQAYRVAGLQINAGSLMARHDRFEEAERLWSEALETFERIGDRRGQAIALGNLAAASSAQGHNRRSESYNRQALALFRELRLDGPRARTAYNLALIASREGRLDEAEVLFAEAQDGFAEAGAVDLQLHVGASRVDYRLLAGDLSMAEALLLELEELAPTGSALRQAAVLAARARLEKWRGNLEPAREAFAAARKLRLESGQEAWVATSDLELLQLALLDGSDPWRVRVRAVELTEYFNRNGQDRAAARSELVAAEALLSQGDTAEARLELDRIRARQERFADLSLALDLAWVEAWAVREEERLPRLESLARRALEHGFFGKLAQIEAGLAARGLSLAGLDIDHFEVQSNTIVALLPPYAANPASVNLRE
jgi:DNA-binding winged helix-turn-helix (wHTH) protein/tetratricopeptide (TPR) repeat protein